MVLKVNQTVACATPPLVHAPSDNISLPLPLPRPYSHTRACFYTRSSSPQWTRSTCLAASLTLSETCVSHVLCSTLMSTQPVCSLFGKKLAGNVVREDREVVSCAMLGGGFLSCKICIQSLIPFVVFCFQSPPNLPESRTGA